MFTDEFPRGQNSGSVDTSHLHPCDTQLTVQHSSFIRSCVNTALFRFTFVFATLKFTSRIASPNNVSANVAFVVAIFSIIFPRTSASHNANSLLVSFDSDPTLTTTSFSISDRHRFTLLPTLTSCMCRPLNLVSSQYIPSDTDTFRINVSSNSHFLFASRPAIASSWHAKAPISESSTSNLDIDAS
ncbi:unnamed protein product [Chondrus crispus]|uniref:Uncharacterized protein n=1 Tax=Chondrus crispus TaxID=2769 RepID=R7Q821_CHOCR|nr:unnamed protein product [Chondrus crispus]CDF33625.1 unnamed protein product [Chondrus crispus]|eukprot:XP_005713428.1 unnamed protein product [Chondrus crispus]